ncbi:ComM, partial [Pasteurella multocida subsp. multocida str. Anand1_cattle]
YSRASMGVQAPLVTIEVHFSNGKPQFNLVGLPEKTVKEAQDPRTAVPCSMPNLNTQLNGSPSISPPPIYPKKADVLIYRSPLV